MISLITNSLIKDQSVKLNDLTDLSKQILSVIEKISEASKPLSTLSYARSSLQDRLFVKVAPLSIANHYLLNQLFQQYPLNDRTRQRARSVHIPQLCHQPRMDEIQGLQNGPLPIPSAPPLPADAENLIEDQIGDRGDLPPPSYNNDENREAFVENYDVPPPPRYSQAILDEEPFEAPSEPLPPYSNIEEN